MKIKFESPRMEPPRESPAEFLPQYHIREQGVKTTGERMDPATNFVLFDLPHNGTFSLPPLATVVKQLIRIKNVGRSDYHITIDPNGAELIDRASAFLLYGQASITLYPSQEYGWIIL